MSKLDVLGRSHEPHISKQFKKNSAMLFKGKGLKKSKTMKIGNPKKEQEQIVEAPMHYEEELVESSDSQDSINDLPQNLQDFVGSLK